MIKKSLLILIITLTVGAFGIFVNTLVYATVYDPANIKSPNDIRIEKSLIADGNYPARLVIPALRVNANIQSTTITKRGTMGTPTNFTDVAWYEYGVAPGSQGEAIIDGHVDNGLGLAGVFKNLKNIENGADIFIVEQDGTKLHFEVTSITYYNYKNVPMQKFLTANGTPKLAFITCEGNWISGEKTYDQRLVVETSLVGVVPATLTN